MIRIKTKIANNLLLIETEHHYNIVMNYVEFKIALIKTTWIPNCELKIELDIDGPQKVVAHRHHLFIDDEKGITCENGWAMSWDEMEKLLEDGNWQNYPDSENEGATIMEANGVRYRIWFFMPQSLDSII